MGAIGGGRLKGACKEKEFINYRCKYGTTDKYRSVGNRRRGVSGSHRGRKIEIILPYY